MDGLAISSQSPFSFVGENFPIAKLSAGADSLAGDCIKAQRPRNSARSAPSDGWKQPSENRFCGTLAPQRGSVRLGRFTGHGSLCDQLGEAVALAARFHRARPLALSRFLISEYKANAICFSRGRKSEARAAHRCQHPSCETFGSLGRTTLARV